MSIVNLAGKRVFLQLKPQPVRPVRSSAIRAWNLRWLQVQRKFGLTVREVAKLVNHPITTVGEGIKWAEAEEERLEQAEIAAGLAEVLDDPSSRDVDDVCSPIAGHPPGTAIGDNPDVRRFLSRMVGRIEALGYDVRPLAVALAGANCWTSTAPSSAPRS